MERIELDQITISTIKKLLKVNYHFPTIEKLGEMKQTTENLNNGFITQDALLYICQIALRAKKNGSFASVPEDWTRGKVHFIKSKFEELLPKNAEFSTEAKGWL